MHWNCRRFVDSNQIVRLLQDLNRLIGYRWLMTVNSMGQAIAIA